MKKCGKCGAEFEGKFCPECGAKWQEKRVCPECGNELAESVRFCPECGCAVGGAQSASPSVASAPAPETAATATAQPIAAERETTAQSAQKYEQKPAQNANTLKTVRTALKYIPFGLFALFSVLLFAFYAGSIAVVEGFGESLGSVYGDITDNIPGMGGCVGALIVFLLASLALSGFMAAALFTNKFKGKAVSIFGKAYMLLTEFLAYLAFALYFIFFVIAIVVMAKVSAFDGGVGMISSGACPKLILAFAIIFSLLTGGALVADMFIVKKFPETATEEKAMRARAIEEKKAADERKRAEKEAEALRAAENNYVEKKEISVTDDTPVCFSGKPVLKKVNVYVRFRRMLKGMGIASMIISISCMSLMGLIMGLGIPKEIIFYVGLGALGLFAFLGILCVLPPASRWSPTQLQKRSAISGGNAGAGRFYITGLIFNCMFLVGVFVIANISLKDEFSGFLIPVGVLVCMVGVFNIMGIIACSVVKSRYKELAKHFYGTSEPYSDTRQVIPFVPEKEKAFYAAYKKNKSVAGNYPNGRVVAKPHAVRSALSVLAAVAVIVAIISFNFVLSPFSASYVSAISKDCDTGYDGTYLEAYLGKADENIKPDGDDGTGRIMMWFDGEYKSAYNKSKKLAEEMEEAVLEGDFEKAESITKEMLELEKSLVNMTFRSLTIRTNKDGYVTSVRLDTRTRVGEQITEKVAEKVELDKGVQLLRGYSPSGSIYAKFYYTDGSYKYEPVPSSAFATLDPFDTGMQTVEWRDEWGSYEMKVSLKDSISGEFKGYKYTLSVNQKTGDLYMKLSGKDVGGLYDYTVTPWDGYAPYVKRLAVSLSSEYHPTMSFVKNFTSLRDLIITENTNYFNMYGLLDLPSLGDIWLEASYMPSDWNISQELKDKIHLGNEWSYVNGEPTLKEILPDTEEGEQI